MRHRSTGSPHQGSALMWFGVLGGGLAWSLHLLASYLLTETLCVSPPLRFEVAGIPGSHFLLLLITLVAALIAAAAVVVGVGQWSTWRNDSERRPAAYLSLTGLILSSTFVVIILVEGLPPLFLTTCGTG